MDDEHLTNLAPDRFDKRIQQRCHPIPAPRIIGDRDYPPTDLDVIHPHTQTFERPQPGAVKRHPFQPVPSRGAFEPPFGLNADESHGMPTPFVRPSKIYAPGQISWMYHSIQTMKRKQRLTLPRCHSITSNSEIQQEHLHFDFPHLQGLSICMPQDNSQNPVDRSLLSADASLRNPTVAAWRFLYSHITAESFAPRYKKNTNRKLIFKFNQDKLNHWPQSLLAIYNPGAVNRFTSFLQVGE